MGDASYNPLSASTLFFASGRNQITASSKVVPGILATINPILTKASLIHAFTFLGGVSSNQTALITAQQCPQCLSSPDALNQTDLRVFDIQAATGTTMVGMIFVRGPILPFVSPYKCGLLTKTQLLTFAFTVFQITRSSAVMVGSKLNLRSTLDFRVVVSLLTYLVISLWYTLINLAFGVPTQRFLGRGGFVVFWLLNMCTMGAGAFVSASGGCLFWFLWNLYGFGEAVADKMIVGLPMESLHTVIGLEYSGYFLAFCESRLPSSS